jgi:hypothetical protein
MDLTVANTILSQIGRGALFMIGAKRFVGDENSVTFSVGRNSGGRAGLGLVSHIRVTLMPSDTYKVESIRIRGASIKTLETRDDIYFDMLAEVIGNLTGMAVSVPRIVGVNA